MPCCRDTCRLAMGRGIAVADSVTEADVVRRGGGGASSGCGSCCALAARRQERGSGLVSELGELSSLIWLKEKVTVLLLGPALLGAGAGRSGWGGMLTSAWGRFHSGVVVVVVVVVPEEGSMPPLSRGCAWCCRCCC